MITWSHVTQEGSFLNVLRWQWDKFKNGKPSISLVGNTRPVAADFERAFPVQAPQYNLLARPPGAGPSHAGREIPV